MRLNLSLAGAFVGATLLASAPVANASTYSVFGDFGTVASKVIYFSGTITTDETSNLSFAGSDAYPITDIAGTLTALGSDAKLILGSAPIAINGLLATGNISNPPHYATANFNGTTVTYDNILYTQSTPHLDNNGVAFTLSDGYKAVIWGITNGAESFYQLEIGSLNTYSQLGFLKGSPLATPLPAALPLFAGGLGVMGLLGWRKKRKNRALLPA